MTVLERKAVDGKQRGAAQMGARGDDRQSADAGGDREEADEPTAKLTYM